MCAIVASFALSANSSTESQLKIAKHEQDGMRAELSAESGLDFAVRQLTANPYWEGTNGEWISITPQQRFQIEVSFSESDTLAGLVASIRSTGASDDGIYSLRMDAVVGTGSSMGDVAAVFLSSNLSMSRGKLNGDVFIPDMVGGVEDYCLDESGARTWTLNESALGTLDLGTTNAIKSVLQFTEDNHFKGNSDVVLQADPYKMPAWDLDSYVDAGNGHIVLEDITEIDGMNTSQTVVVILAEGETLSVEGSNLHGGLVIWAPADYDLRSGPRNQVTVNASNIGTGSAPHIGLMAPAAQVSGTDSGLNFHGLCFWNSIQDLHKAHIAGALVVVNDVANCTQLNLNGHPQTMANLPDGIYFNGEGEGIDLVASGEDFN